MPYPVAAARGKNFGNQVASLPFSDDFSSGATLGARWTSGGTWSITGGKALNTPTTTGANLCLDPDMEAVGVANWDDVGTPTTKDKSGDQKHGGAQSLRIIGDAAGDGASQSATLSASKWYQVTGWGYASASPRADMGANLDGVVMRNFGLVNTASFAQYGPHLALNLAEASRVIIQLKQRDAGALTFYLDDVDVREVDITKLIAAVEGGAANVTAQVVPTPATPAAVLNPLGLIVNLDSTVTPQNYVLALLTYNGGSRIRLYKCVSGSISQVLDGALAYSAGAALKVVKSGTSYSVYYNNVQVGTTQTINEPTINSNTQHGMLACVAADRLDDFSLTSP